VGVIQPDGGFLDIEPSIAAHISLANAAGAEIRCGETVHAIEPHPGGVRIVTERGSVEAGVAIIAAGAWMQTLVPSLAATLRVTRQVMGWFAISDAELFSDGRCPVFIERFPRATRR
jgi:sarcosine oxidase